MSATLFATTIEWKRRARRYQKSGMWFERLESTDGVYTLGYADTGLSDDQPRYHALVKIGRQERLISTHRTKIAAQDACERHAATH